MMIKKGIVLVCVMLFCLAAPILAEEFQTQIDEAKNKAAFFVAYDKDTGEPFAVIESPEFKVIKQGKTPSITLDELKNLLDELGKSGEKVVDIGSSVMYVHGSPGCYIRTASGGWKCICPR